VRAANGRIRNEFPLLRRGDVPEQLGDRQRPIGVENNKAVTLDLQAAMNIAVVTVSIPTKGIALPLVSYGGSALVVTLAAVGVLLNISKGNGVRRTR
jgi:hypothetical protein